METAADTHMTAEEQVSSSLPAAASAAVPAPTAPHPAAAAAATAAHPAPAPTASVLPPTRALLYSLIIRQLRDDGLDGLAVQLSTHTGVGVDASFPRHQLGTLVDSALAALTVQEGAERARMELGRAEDAAEVDSDLEDAGAADTAAPSSDPFARGGAQSALLDLTAHTRISTLSTPFPAYSSRFGYGHTDAVTCAAFSSDGALAATGSRDSSIKLVDVARMRSAPALDTLGGGRMHRKRDPVQQSLHPLVRTYFDHDAPISDLAFHPFETFLLSGSRDQTLKLFNYASALVAGSEDTSSGALARKCTKVLALENAPVTSLSFHPSGDFALVGTEQNFCRLYDVQTFSAYVSPDFANFHAGSITSVRFHPVRGSSYATGSTDGTVKLWDGVSNSLIRTIPNAHGGAEVSSVEYSPSGKYLLTSGLDSTAKLWDLDSARCLMTYHGARHQTGHVKANFEHSGEFVMCGDETSAGMAVWVRNKRTRSTLRLCARRLGSVAQCVTCPCFPLLVGHAHERVGSSARLPRPRRSLDRRVADGGGLPHMRRRQPSTILDHLKLRWLDGRPCPLAVVARRPTHAYTTHTIQHTLNPSCASAHPCPPAFVLIVSHAHAHTCMRWSLETVLHDGTSGRHGPTSPASAAGQTGLVS